MPSTEAGATSADQQLSDFAAGARWLWWLTLGAGLLSLVVGVIVLVRPGTSLATLAVITGIFLVADGVIASCGRPSGPRRAGRCSPSSAP